METVEESVTYFFDENGEMRADYSSKEPHLPIMDYPQSHFEDWNSNEPYQPSFLFDPLNSIKKFLIKFFL